ncbi:hypothetical protein EYF80_038198 [Liparis tanakae]|uniref:Uncharacterized protein n=1 Tax=Liparis tanakae TaxID=230148 RepID=A0A4Z2GG29_9TELE|nr:hypothetical protein EYF80_038198 [Liparis tanakae]
MGYKQRWLTSNGVQREAGRLKMRNISEEEEAGCSCSLTILSSSPPLLSLPYILPAEGKELNPKIFTCVSLSSRLAATSTLLPRVRYLLKWNSFSSSVSCLVVKLVRITLCCPGIPNSDRTAVEREVDEWMMAKKKKHDRHGAEAWP